MLGAHNSDIDILGSLFEEKQTTANFKSRSPLELGHCHSLARLSLGVGLEFIPVVEEETKFFGTDTQTQS